MKKKITQKCLLFICKLDYCIDFSVSKRVVFILNAEKKIILFSPQELLENEHGETEVKPWSQCFWNCFCFVCVCMCVFT